MEVSSIRWMLLAKGRMSGTHVPTPVPKGEIRVYPSPPETHGNLCDSRIVDPAQIAWTIQEIDRAVNVPYLLLPSAPNRAFSIPLANASVRA